MFSTMSTVPHTMLSQSAPPQSVPQTMFSSPSAVPQTMLPSASVSVPHTMLPSASLVPQTMLPHSASPHAVPQTMFSPSSSVAAPQVVPALKAFAVASIAPPVNRWLPQMRCLLHIFWVGIVSPGCAFAKKRARRTAPIALRNPAPCVSPLYAGYCCAVY